MDDIKPTAIGLLRYPRSEGYFVELGEDEKVACTCNDKCKWAYCSGQKCGCKACSLRLTVTMDETNVYEDDGFRITYEEAFLRYGPEVADAFKSDWSDMRHHRVSLKALRASG